MSLIPLGAYTVPLELVTRLKSLLILNPLFPMSINTAIQAVILYLRTKDSTNYDAEGLAYISNLRTQLRHPVPMVDLEVFVLYFPHLLRWHEAYALSRYIHPFRLYFGVTILVARHPAESCNQIRHCRREQNPSPSPRHDFYLSYPPCRPYSAHPTSVMARESGEIACGGNHRETPSREPFKLCMFDDIKTLGLPMYHPRATETQLVALPASMANEITNSQGMRFFMPLVPSSAFWIPSPKRALVSLSGGAEMIGPVFKPVDGKDVGPLGGEEGLLGEGNPSWIEHSLPHPISHLMSRQVHEAINHRNVRPPARASEDGEAGRRQGQWNERDSVLPWDGLQSEVIKAVASNEIPAWRPVQTMDEVVDDDNAERQDVGAGPGETAESLLAPTE